MPFYTPLRYPGGKRKLLPIVARLLDHNGLADIQYVEPYAGGAAVALGLLFEDYAADIHINDLSRPVFAFWHCVLNQPADLCQRIRTVRLSMREWFRQREVYEARDTAELDDLGFAAFFLNRANRSGIIGGGVIGGKEQRGDWGLDARFSRDELVRRIRRIGRYASRIHLYQKDALDFSKTVLPQLGRRTFAYFDPPYIENGRQLYLNNLQLEDHRALAARVSKLSIPWIVTYDYSAVTHKIYPEHRRIVFQLNYTAQSRYKGQEVMFLSDQLQVPRLSDLLAQRGRFKTVVPVPYMSRVASSRKSKSLPETDEGPGASERFIDALRTVVSVPKRSVPSPFGKRKKQKK